MKRENWLIIIGVISILVSCGLIFGGASLEEQSYKRLNTNGVVTKTITSDKTESPCTNSTVTKIFVEQHTKTVTKNNYITSTVTNDKTTLQTVTVEKNIPAYNQNDQYQIRMYLKAKLDALRQVRGLDKLYYNVELARFAETKNLPENATQTFTLIEYILDREGHECWRGDLYVANWVGARIGDTYKHTLYNPITHGVGSYVEVDLYKIYVRCVFLGG